MKYLAFDLDEGTDGVNTLEAMASTSAEQHAAVLAEAQRVLDWAWQHFPDSHGRVDDGMAWDHHLLVQLESGGWHTVTLTLAASPQFVDAFLAAFGGSTG